MAHPPALHPSLTGSGVESLRDALCRNGVFVLSPAKQLSTAAELAAAGVQPRDIESLRTFLAAGEENEGAMRRYLAAVLADPERAKEALEGLSKWRSRQQEDVGVSTSTHIRGWPCPYWTCTCQSCFDARARGVPEQGPRPAYLLDGVAPRAAERRPMPKVDHRAPDAQVEHNKRVQEFRASMRRERG